MLGRELIPEERMSKLMSLILRKEIVRERLILESARLVLKETNVIGKGEGNCLTVDRRETRTAY